MSKFTSDAFSVNAIANWCQLVFYSDYVSCMKNLQNLIGRLLFYPMRVDGK